MAEPTLYERLGGIFAIAAAAPLPGFPEVQPICNLDPQEVHG